MNNKKTLNIDIFLFLYLSLLNITLFESVVKCINFLLFNSALNNTICIILALLIFTTILILLFKYKFGLITIENIDPENIKNLLCKNGYKKFMEVGVDITFIQNN